MQDEGGAGEQSADGGQEPEAPREVAKTEALPRDRTEALYRSLELKASQKMAGFLKTAA